MVRALLHAPGAEELAAFLEEHLRSGCLVQVAGELEIVYEGRAASLAEAGDYVLIVKADGSLQVHGASGMRPLNWQPRTDDLRVRLLDGRATLAGERRRPPECVTVTFHRAALALALELRDEASFYLSGTERQMQDALALNPDIIEPGLSVLDREVLVGVGGIDLYAKDSQDRPVVVELKRGRATQDAVSQLERYVGAVRAREGGGVHVRGILAAAAITGPARAHLERLGLEFVEVDARRLEAGPPAAQD